jgi:hypothetical protein
VATFDFVDRDLGGSDAVKCGFGHGYVGGQWLRRYGLSEQTPLLIDTAADGEG